ncbi:MAG: phage portal protein, partial [Deltaproteobacteria bacterium RBG_13_58_19]
GVTDTLTVNVIGQGLQPQSRLRAEELGISEEEAQSLRRRAETIFDRWQKYADASNRQKFNGLQALAFRKIVEDGEIITNLPMLNDPWRPLKRGLELIEADRLGTPFGKQGVFSGIEVGSERKEPLKYWIRKANLTTNDYEMLRYEWVGLPARDSRGRPLLLHTYFQKRPGQLRGIPFLAPALTYFKHFADYLSAEVVAAKIAACVALVISQSDPMGALNPPTTSAPGQGEDKKLEKWEPASILRLAVGESATMIDPKRGGETFATFVVMVLRIISASTGLPYELLLKDFSKTNYSSARAALLEARRWFMFLRAYFGQEWCQPIWELILEEAYLDGSFPAKNFYEYQAEYCRAQWIGGGWGWVDPVKEVKASIEAINAGLSTHAKEIAGQGEDWEETFDQLMREKKYAQAMGLTFQAPAPASRPVQKEEKEEGEEDAQNEE